MSIVPSYESWRKVPLGPEWAENFASFRYSAFRLEVLQAYAEPDEAKIFEQFLNGETIPENWISEWCSLVSSNVSRGKTMQRVHLVSLPLTDYLHFEIQHGYRHTIRAGEKIFVIDSSTLDENHGFHEDFWLFDDSKVMIQIYNDTGTMQHSYHNDDPTIVSRYIEIRDSALNKSEPVKDFYQREFNITL